MRHSDLFPVLLLGTIFILLIFMSLANLSSLVLAGENIMLENSQFLFLPLAIKADFTEPSATPTPAPSMTPVPTSTFEPPNGLIWVDKNSIALFDHIPEEFLTAARDTFMLFADRSVGGNISDGLDCLTATSWSQSPAHCRRAYYDDDWNWKTYTQADLDQGLVPPEILFAPDPLRYNRDNWTYEFHMGTWSELTQDFIHNLAPAYINNKDVLSYQFSYLNVTEGDDIIDSQVGFFTDNLNRYTVYDLEAYISQNPEKVFIFWTTSLARSIGSQVSTDFNYAMRQYATDHSKIMFDVADILSHRPDETPCYDNRDGVPYCDMHGNCEDHPDDGLELPAICQEYTTETEGGHLGSVSAGKIRVAKAFWVLMARIAGWDGSH